MVLRPEIYIFAIVCIWIFLIVSEVWKPELTNCSTADWDPWICGPRITQKSHDWMVLVFWFCPLHLNTWPSFSTMMFANWQYQPISVGFGVCSHKVMTHNSGSSIGMHVCVHGWWVAAHHLVVACWTEAFVKFISLSPFISLTLAVSLVFGFIILITNISATNSCYRVKQWPSLE